MALWTDVIDPANLTGYARKSLREYEQAKGSLADYLPNLTVADIAVRVIQGDNGLVDTANFRAYDAEIEFGKAGSGTRKMVELPALGQQIPISEYAQLRQRNASENEMLRAITATTDRVVAAVADSMEYMRGQVLTTGKATIDQPNFKTDDDFGRDADMSVTAGTLWSDPSSDPLADLTAYVDAYIARNGEAPGALVGSQQVLRALANHAQFSVKLGDGATRPGSTQSVSDTLLGQGLPAFEVRSRRVRRNGVAVNVLPTDRVFMLPAKGQSGLGGTYWGETLSASEPEWGIANEDRPGIVTGTFTNPKPPHGKQVFADAIGLPILANANLAFTAKVL